MKVPPPKKNAESNSDLDFSVQYPEPRYSFALPKGQANDRNMQGPISPLPRLPLRNFYASCYTEPRDIFRYSCARYAFCLALHICADSFERMSTLKQEEGIIT